MNSMFRSVSLSLNVCLPNKYTHHAVSYSYTYRILITFIYHSDQISTKYKKHSNPYAVSISMYDYQVKWLSREIAYLNIGKIKKYSLNKHNSVLFYQTVLIFNLAIRYVYHLGASNHQFTCIECNQNDAHNSLCIIDYKRKQYV